MVFIFFHYSKIYFYFTRQADNRRKSKRDIKPNMRYGHNDVKPKPVNITDSGKNRQKPKQNKTNLGTGDVVEPLRRKATEITTATGGVSETVIFIRSTYKRKFILYLN